MSQIAPPPPPAPAPSPTPSLTGNFLQRHAYDNVWCAPNRDKQVILKLARLTGYGGAWNKVKVMWRTEPLPDTTSQFHVYQIGEIHPLLLGLLDQQNTWLNVADTCNVENFMADLYVATGIQIHRSQAWYRVTEDKNLIVAIRHDPFARFGFDLNTDDVFLRLYANDYYNTEQAVQALDVIHVQGTYIADTVDVLAFQAAYQPWQAQTDGYTYFFLNGNRVDTIDLVNTAIGDYVEFVYDGSIKNVITWDISALTAFTSTLDSMNKYLLHYAGQSNLIDSQDEIDVYLIKKTTGTRYVGVYYHKNNAKALRNVTHKDYAIAVPYIAAFVSERAELGGDVDNVSIIMHIRHSGYLRPLVNENSRIQDLYRMQDVDVRNAMLGVQSTVTVWTAPALEASQYCAIMRAPYGTITTNMVTAAYGYNAVSKLIGDTPTLPTTQDGVPPNSYIVPIGLQGGYTAYEYDANGLLLEFHTGSGAGLYASVNPATTTVEFLFGTGGTALDESWNQVSTTIDPNYNYRFYNCGITLGNPDNLWVDHTGDSTYGVVNNVATWVTNPSLKYSMVRSNKKHLAYELDITPTDGLIRFQISQYRADKSATLPLTVPMGRLDLFLNGRSLKEDLDYKVDFPIVTIINKKYLVNPDTQAQKIVVRHTGFCDNTLHRDVPADTGFVEYGVLSFDNQYEVRHDKVIRITIDGKLTPISALTFAENSFLAQVTNAMNGLPYVITEIVVPMNSYISEASVLVDPTYDMRQQSKTIDAAVQAYLTQKLPQQTVTGPNAILELYPVVSPFFCKLIHDLNSGALTNPLFTQQYSDNDAAQILQPYVYLLADDPCSDNNAPDPTFVIIHPHNQPGYVQMGIYQYKFLQAAVRLYGNGRVILSPYVSVAQFGS